MAKKNRCACGRPKQKLWAEMWDTTKAPRASEIFEYAQKGGQLKHDSAGYRKIETLRELGGQELLDTIERAGLSHAILSTARAVCRYVDGDLKDKAWMQQVLNWLISGRRQFKVRTAINQGVPPARLYKAIKKNQDLNPWE